MIDEHYINFIPGIKPEKHDEKNDLWFIFNSGKLMLVNTNSKLKIPFYSQIEMFRDSLENINYLGQLKGIDCYTAEILNVDSLQNKFLFEDLRNIMTEVDEDLFTAGGRAVQIINWDKEHKFCGKCGSPMIKKDNERAKQCTSCGFLNYPRISPAIIVAVRNGDKLLLAHNKNFKTGLYSCIAGFVDPGETFEQCVKREVLEEVGIKVKNIKYFSSQPWPFPNSLMIAFTAEYDGDNISVDGVEIEHADWFAVEALPIIPAQGTIARKLIDSFINEMQQAF